MKQQPLVYVIVLGYNAEPWLEACFSSLRRTNYANLRVLFVDNNSSDRSVEIVSHNFPKVEIVVNFSNIGFSDGNNVGIRRALAANADYVVLLNPDTKVEPEWLTHLVNIGEATAEIGVLGAVQLNYENDDFNSWTKTALKHHLEELLVPEKSRDWIPVEWVEGACFAIKRQVFEKIGLLDPIFFAFYEEIDFCRRAIRGGYEVALVPRSRIRHYRGGSWEATPEQKRERDYLCDRSQFVYNLTTPDGSLAMNLVRYGKTLLTKIHELMATLDKKRAWDLLRMQWDLLTGSRRILKKWRRDRKWMS